MTISLLFGHSCEMRLMSRHMLMPGMNCLKKVGTRTTSVTVICVTTCWASWETTVAGKLNTDTLANMLAVGSQQRAKLIMLAVLTDS